MFHTVNQCEIIFSGGRTRSFIFPATDYYINEVLNPSPNYYQFERYTGILGSVGTPECAPPPFEDEYATNSFFSCKFQTDANYTSLLEELKRDNGITSTTVVNQWVFDFGTGNADMGKIHSSSFTWLDSGEHINPSWTSPWYEATYYPECAAPASCKWFWINFRITTYSRFLPAYDPNPSIANLDPNNIGSGGPKDRKRRSITDTLDTVSGFNEAIVANIMANLTLPAGTVVRDTTPVVTEMTMIALNGDTSGECGDGGCTCINGYEMDGSGRCVPSADTTDTCSSDPDICSDNASCMSYSTGGSQCICNTGFEGDGIDCADTNECYRDICPAHSICDNTVGSFACTCEEGFEKIGMFCVDLNECHDVSCDAEYQFCRNTEGSYECQCQTGYNMVDGDCELGMLKQISSITRYQY